MSQAKIETFSRDVDNTQVLGLLNNYFGPETKRALQHILVVHNITETI